MSITSITELFIRFDQREYYAGQMITGQVVFALDKPNFVDGIELKVKGRAKVILLTEVDSDDEERSVLNSDYVAKKGKESYLRNVQKLEGKKELNPGEHTYSFSVNLPASAPSTFTGKYGGIAYYAKAKVNILFGADKTVKKLFDVENRLDLNLYPELKNPVQREESRTYFCCFSCARGSLDLTVFLPKTGFSRRENFYITVEIVNASNVDFDKVKVWLCRKIHWKAVGYSEEETDKFKITSSGCVWKHTTVIFTEAIRLDCGPLPNIKNCNIITVDYELKIEGKHDQKWSNLEIYIPITIGDIPIRDGDSGAPAGSTGYSLANPTPGGFMPSDTGLDHSNEVTPLLTSARK